MFTYSFTNPTTLCNTDVIKFTAICLYAIHNWFIIWQIRNSCFIITHFLIHKILHFFS